MTVGEAIKEPTATYVNYPPHEMQSLEYTRPITLSRYRRFHWVREMLRKRSPGKVSREAGPVFKMKPGLAVLLVLLLPRTLANAQTFQFLPEVDAYYKLKPAVRLDFQAKDTREAGDPTQAEIGPSLDFFVKPLVRLENIPIFDPGNAKSRVLQLFIGYRCVPSPDKPTVERMQVGFIANLPLPAKILFSDRNRADLDWSTSPFVWRYRNRAKFQRAVSIRSYKPSPYASIEFFYQSQYQKWSTTALYAGCLFPAGKRFSLDAYYEHQNITSKRPNNQLNQLGLILNMYFARKKG